MSRAGAVLVSLFTSCCKDFVGNFVGALLMVLFTSSCPAFAAKVTVVPEWQPFEHAFKSSVLYPNALQEASLTVTFTSPAGQTTRTEGFWDGGRVWRVRFSPDQVGRWSYAAECSDTSNPGLHGQRGEFICSAPIATGPFWKHGPIRVAIDHHHFEHADGTPFFWLADTVWDGAQISKPQEWLNYALVRGSQNFTVVQWIAAPGQDDRGQHAIERIAGQIAVNTGFFQRLDQKVAILRQAGLLNAIVPFSEGQIDTNGVGALGDSEKALLIRYVVARYAADPVAWLISVDGKDAEKQATFWKSIGPAVFGETNHAPVVFCSGNTPRRLEPFRNAGWVDAFGYPGDDVSASDNGQGAPNSFQTGAFREATRPVIVSAPFENSISDGATTRISAEIIRRSVYSSLFSVWPAGVSYGAEGVLNWDRSVDRERNAGKPGDDLALWERSLFLPGAKQMGVLAAFANSVDFWRLKPAPELLVPEQPASRPAQIASATAGAPMLETVYDPQNRPVELLLSVLPPSPNIVWLNPRIGSASPAVGVVGNVACQFPAPGPGDWLLVIKSGK